MEDLLFGPLAVLLFIVVLGGIVLVHELGHFITARRLGVRVLEFGIGFPPRAKVLRSKGETLVTLNWLPIGGFVRMDGEDGDGADDPQAFSAKSLRVRLAILAAGVGMNLVLAFSIFFLIALLATPVLGLRLTTIEDSSPAAIAGLKPTDEIYSVTGQEFELFGGDSVVDALRRHAGETIAIGVRHADGAEEQVTVTLRPKSEIGPERGALGIRSPEQTTRYIGHDPLTSARIAADELVRWGGLIFRGLGELVDGFIKDPTAPPPASGPIGIAVSLAEILLNAGPILLLYVAGILSVNLAVVNALPFPPLDGGRMTVLVIKRVFGSRVSLRAERVTYAVGFVFLMAFVLWVSGFDIARLGTNP